MSDWTDCILLPRPREITPANGTCTLRSGQRICIRGEAGTGVAATGSTHPLLPLALRVQRIAERELRMAWSISAGAGASAAAVAGDIALALRRGSAPAQGYAIEIAPDRILLEAADPAGLLYATSTFAQIVRQLGARLPCGRIKDWPDFPVRGFMLDISRTRVPTMPTLYGLIEQLAELKINHLELYTEHTFAYRDHRDVWAQSSPMTGEEMLLLDAYCRDRFIELTPNQASFGHLERWLPLPRYIGLAECPDGFAWPWGGRSAGPFSLDPSNPGSIALLEELYAELLPHFSSPRFNVGCDETFDLGQGKSRALCERRGRGRVYLDFLNAIHALVRKHGRTMLYWGDIIMEHPELVPELPKDAVALEWGYEHDHPFDEHAARYAKAGVPWWICPGTSTWNSIAGRTDNCLANLRNAARAGLANGATGYLNTDWGDNGHWQPMSVSWPGIAAGAALSWCAAACGEGDFAKELDAHVFRDAAGVMGRLSLDLGNTYVKAGDRIHNASPLFEILRDPARTTLPAGVTMASLDAATRWIQSAAAGLGHARMDRPDAALAREEYAFVVELMLLAAERGRALLASQAAAERFRQGMQAIIGVHRELWVKRSRIGGLAESAQRMERLVSAGT